MCQNYISAFFVVKLLAAICNCFIIYVNGTDQFFSCCPKFARRFLGPVNRLGNANPSLKVVQGVQGVKVSFSFMRVTFSGDMVHCFKSVMTDTDLR